MYPPSSFNPPYGLVDAGVGTPMDDLLPLIIAASGSLYLCCDMYCASLLEAGLFPPVLVPGRIAAPGAIFASEVPALLVVEVVV